MSIEVKNLTKIYGRQRAIDDLSFSVPAGQIVGFLGPNGAGKSTTMKILTCFIPPTAGEAFVCGMPVEDKSIEVRKMVGYLPEHNPLYLDMFVKEYLLFIAGMHRVPNATKRVEEMIALTGLTAERKKKLGQLSKGYRQRAGLAQAMLHNPKVLILDEPTSGLDPNQIGEIRKLIREIGKEKTVLLSTHIMQEVEAICDRTIIINKGKIVADDITSNLRSTANERLVFTVQFKGSPDIEKLKSLQGVVAVSDEGGAGWRIECEPDNAMNERLFTFAVQNALVILEMKQEQYSLEDVFHKLTGYVDNI